jgi:hypothetical protein
VTSVKLTMGMVGAARTETRVVAIDEDDVEEDVKEDVVEEEVEEEVVEELVVGGGAT